MKKYTTTFKRCGVTVGKILFSSLDVVRLCGMTAVGFLYVIVQAYVLKTYGFR